jgi:single-strand DNA-binding protein
MARTEFSETTASSTDGRENDNRRWRGPVINRVHLLGRLTADPTLGRTRNGIPVAHVRMATNDRHATEFHQVVAWRQLAEIVMQHACKGQMVHVVGSLHGNAWTGADGTKHDGTEIIADSFQVLDRKPTA